MGSTCLCFGTSRVGRHSNRYLFVVNVAHAIPSNPSWQAIFLLSCLLLLGVSPRILRRKFNHYGLLSFLSNPDMRGVDCGALLIPCIFAIESSATQSGDPLYKEINNSETPTETNWNAEVLGLSPFYCVVW